MSIPVYVPIPGWSQPSRDDIEVGELSAKMSQETYNRLTVCEEKIQPELIHPGQMWRVRQALLWTNWNLTWSFRNIKII